MYIYTVYIYIYIYIYLLIYKMKINRIKEIGKHSYITTQVLVDPLLKKKRDCRSLEKRTGEGSSRLVK